MTRELHSHTKILKISSKTSYHTVFWIVKIDIWMYPASSYCLQEDSMYFKQGLNIQIIILIKLANTSKMHNPKQKNHKA